MAYHTSRESVAYDYDVMLTHFSRTPPEEVQQPQPQPQLQAIPGGKAKEGASSLFRARTLATVMMVLLVAGVILHSYMLVSQLTSSVARGRSELDELEAINTALLTKQEYALNDETIEEYAQQAGMFKLDNSQVEWFEMSKPDKVEVSGTGVGIGGVLGRIMQSFSAALEYLH